MRKLQFGVVSLVVVLACAVGASAQTLYEDFQGGVLPAGWAVEDVDGLIPSDDGFWGTSSSWMVVPEAGANYAAESTSWYTTGGTANDWIITPQVTPVTGDLLTWDARVESDSYPDGYEVRYSTTTQTAAGCLANPALLTVAAENEAWTGHSVSLAAHVGIPTYYCFRNNSTNMWNLYVDNVRIGGVINYDLSLDGLTNPHQYGWVPDFLSPTFTLEGQVTNSGPQTLTNVELLFDLNVDGTPLATMHSNLVPSLATGLSSTLTATPYVPAGATVTITATADMTETDDAPADNSSYRVHQVTSDYVSRSDWDSVLGSVGFNGNTGYFGTMFDMGTSLDLLGVDFIMGGATSGTSYSVTVWSWVAGAPGTILATSDPFIRTGAAYDYVYVEFPGGPVTVPAQFFVAVYQPAPGVNMGMYYTEHAFTAGSVMYKTDAGSWTATTFNFMLGAVFDVTPANTAPVVTITAPADPSSFTEFDLVSFTGTAIDTEDGDITASLTWTSSIDGAIGTGGSFSTSALSVGVHTITAAVTDSGALPGQDTVAVTITVVADAIFLDGFESGNTSAWSNILP